MAAAIDYALPDSQATEIFGACLARVMRPGDVVTLAGDLGAGKTTLARGLVRTFMSDATQDVPSPTYTLVQTYENADTELWHCDLYRLSGLSDAYELGLEDAFEHAIVLIEWADRIAPILPDDRLEVCLAFADSGKSRTAHMIGHGEWSARLEHF